MTLHGTFMFELGTEVIRHTGVRNAEAGILTGRLYNGFFPAIAHPVVSMVTCRITMESTAGAVVGYFLDGGDELILEELLMRADHFIEDLRMQLQVQSDANPPVGNGENDE